MSIKLSISYGNSRQAINWSQQQTEFPELAERLKTTLRTSETAEQYHKMKKTEKDVCKDHGGFMGGKLKAGRRLRTNVIERSMLTEDVDHPDAEFLFRYSEGCRYETVLYSTHSHTPEAPRYRLVIPFTRPVNTDEYNAIARLYAAEYEIECFDPCSFIPNQMMYWPSTPSDGEYVYKHFDGDYLDPDAFLAKYPNWKDCEKLPRCASENTARGIGGKKIQDPLTKTDIVGAWCRAHSIYDVLDNILRTSMHRRILRTDTTLSSQTAFPASLSTTASSCTAFMPLIRLSIWSSMPLIWSGCICSRTTMTRSPSMLWQTMPVRTMRRSCRS